MKNIFVKLKNGNVEIEHIREMVNEFKNENFIYKDWFPRAGLKEKNSEFVSRLYIGQSYDKNQFDLVEKGWINDHCEICFLTLGENESEYIETSGYFNGQDWICKTCFEELVLSNDINQKLDSFEQ